MSYVGIKGRDVQLFAATFVSAVLLFAGLSTLGLMTFPVIAATVFPPPPYQPLLPVSDSRDEPVYDIASQQFTQPYPPLTQTPDAADGNWIRIPSIDVNVPLVLSPSVDDKDVLATLDSGAAMYPNGILPGHIGNVFVSAHSTGEPWKGAYRFAFLRISELEPGNVMNIDYNGTRYTYTITGSDIIVPTPDYRVVSDRPVPTLTLMACWPLWSTRERMLVRAELTNVTQLTVPHSI